MGKSKMLRKIFNRGAASRTNALPVNPMVI